jgi:GNAT superfamily N-acetyltransferase
VHVALVTEVTPELEALWSHARHDVLAKRGGVALMATLCGTTDENGLLHNVIASSSLWSIEHEDQLKGFGICREQIIEAIYVTRDFRRHKAATALVEKLLAGSTPPIDAYALPGDRAMKSLYESIGWKARLLTMRGA